MYIVIDFTALLNWTVYEVEGEEELQKVCKGEKMQTNKKSEIVDQLSIDGCKFTMYSTQHSSN